MLASPFSDIPFFPMLLNCWSALSPFCLPLLCASVGRCAGVFRLPPRSLGLIVSFVRIRFVGDQKEKGSLWITRVLFPSRNFASTFLSSCRLIFQKCKKMSRLSRRSSSPDSWGAGAPATLEKFCSLGVESSKDDIITAHPSMEHRVYSVGLPTVVRLSATSLVRNFLDLTLDVPMRHSLCISSFEMIERLPRGAQT